MDLNITGVDNQLYYDVNVALNVCFFIFLSLLPLLLCVLVILALVLAKTINIKIRVLLINIFAVEILGRIIYAIYFLGWIVRLNYNEIISCKLFYIAYIVASVQKCTCGTLYAINIFLFIKYGEKKLKWSVIIPSIVLSWVMISIISIILVLVLPPDSVRYSFGSCYLRIVSSPLIPTILVVLIAQSFVFMIIQIVMAIVTCVYIKKHTLEGNVQIKKAVTKVLVYIIVVSINNFISTIIPVLSYFIGELFPGSSAVVTTARNYICLLITCAPGLATPLVTIALLKPVRDEIKKMSKILFCNKDNRIHPAVDSNDIELT